MLNSFSLRVNRLSTRKKGSKMNHRDVLIAEEQENSREITTGTSVAIITEAKVLVTDGK